MDLMDSKKRIMNTSSSLNILDSIGTSELMCFSPKSEAGLQTVIDEGDFALDISDLLTKLSLLSASDITEESVNSVCTGTENRVCITCGTTTTPLWRKDENGGCLCNACGLYQKLTGGTTRSHVKPQRGRSKKTGVVCVNCQTGTTSLWRRNADGETVCNACGLYFKMHGVNRPPNMKKGGVRKRKGKLKNDNSTVKEENHDIDMQDVGLVHQILQDTTSQNGFDSVMPENTSIFSST